MTTRSGGDGRLPWLALRACVAGWLSAGGTLVAVVLPIMFAFYSNRLGCVGSLLLSLVGTAVLAALMWLVAGR